MAFLERDLMRKWIKHIEESEPEADVRRVEESPNGIKPYDVQVLRKDAKSRGCGCGHSYAYEFKRWTKKRKPLTRESALALLTAHQRYFLEKHKAAGGTSIVYVFTRDQGPFVVEL